MVLEDNPKCRVLCLHGMGANSEILEAQTALRYGLGGAFEYHFVDGSYPWPAAPGLPEVYGKHQLCYSYHNGTLESLKQAIEDLKDYVSQNGPFDAIMGFSLGAGLAVAYLLRLQNEKSNGTQKDRSTTIRYGIFVCPVLPGDLEAFLEDVTGATAHEPTSVRLDLPTVHSWSQEDREHSHHGPHLVALCTPSGRIELMHEGGHIFPTRGMSLENLVDAIQLQTMKLR